MCVCVCVRVRVCVCVRARARRLPHTNKKFSDASWMSKNSNQSWYCLPGDRIRFYRLRFSPTRQPSTSDSSQKPRFHAPNPPVTNSRSQWPPPTQDANHKSSCYLYFWSTGYESEVPTSPSSGWINLLEQLTALRKTHFLTGLPVYYRRIWRKDRYEHPDRRDTQGKVYGRGVKLPCSLQVHDSARSPHVHQLGISPNSVLWVFMEASLLRHNWLTHWPLAIDSTSSPSLLPGVQGGGGDGVKILTL